MEEIDGDREILRSLLPRQTGLLHASMLDAILPTIVVPGLFPNETKSHGTKVPCSSRTYEHAKAKVTWKDMLVPKLE